MLLPSLLGLVLTLAASQPAVISVYVGFPTREGGFVDADRETSDSIRDIREALATELAKASRGAAITFHLVNAEAGADVKLYVMGRGHGPVTSAGTVTLPGTTTYTPGTTTTTQVGGVTLENTTPGTVTTAPGTTIAIESKLNYVATSLRVGTFERAFVGQGQDASWRKCAKKIAQDVTAWLTANGERIKPGTPDSAAKKGVG